MDWSLWLLWTISAGAFGGIMYYAGLRHGWEKAQKFIDEFTAKADYMSKNPITYLCCEHCVDEHGHYTEEHYDNAQEGAMFAFDYHLAPCNEPGFCKGKQINTKIPHESS